MTWLTWKLALTAITGLFILAYWATKLDSTSDDRLVKAINKLNDQIKEQA